jgi:hypothetical protein
MDRLLKFICLQDDTLYLNLYTEIASECDVYASPKRLVPALSRLIEISLLPSFINGHSSILHSIGSIMLRRKNILARLNDKGRVRNNVEFKTYEELKTKLSMEYGDSSFWVSPDKSKADNIELIATLQAAGILSLFHNYNSDSDDERVLHTLTTETQFPFPHLFSMRSAHSRLGPCLGFNNILTDPWAYNNFNFIRPKSESTGSGESQAPSPLSNIDHSSVLHVVFDYL